MLVAIKRSWGSGLRSYRRTTSNKGPRPDASQPSTARLCNRSPVFHMPTNIRIILLPWLIASCLSAAADRLPERADRVVDYRIQVRLDPKAKQLNGQERITWRNPSQDQVGELWFHLYFNGFKNSRTTLQQNRGFRSGVKESTWGWVDVVSLRLENGTDLTKGMSFEHPDDGNTDDQTVVKVKLPQPVPPGGQVSVRLSFRAQLPDLRVRTGHSKGTFMVAQWFPKLGVYEPAGMRGRTTGGWNCHQFHPNSEFYADYGHYSTEITIPSSFRIGATGQLRWKKDNGKGESTYLFEEDNIHDFAWTAGPDYVVVKKKFSGRTDVSEAEYQQTARLLDRPLDEVRLSDVDLIFLMQPNHLDQLGRYERAARLTLKWYGLWYGRYPYKTLTVVDPVGPGGGGMEYPTLITAGTSELFSYRPFDRILFPELVTVHEAGHQWWYAMVGNNEFEEAWLDEGINSYSTGRAIEQSDGGRGRWIQFLGVELTERDIMRLENSPFRRYDTSLQPSWSYQSDYSFYSYTKPELMLRTLENHIGKPAMARIMRTYHERWRFRHPGSQDFIDVANEVSGRDLNWFFDQFLKGSGPLDYQIAEVSTYQVPDPVGIFDRPAGKVTLPAKGKQASGKGTGQRQFRSRVLVRRNSDAWFPVDVLLTFEDGHKVLKRWDGKARWTRLSEDYSSRLAKAEVDPEHKIELDVNWTNNSRAVKADSRLAAKWFSHILFALQGLLSLIGLLA
ncbi:MAG: M1 family peptidase [Acidobacteria bacterium]|nr:MAG: M1 family peptidase [Acidobacteriota bacterium]